MEKQHKKLLNALVLVVENLRNPEVLGAVLDSLGARHVGYGAIPQYYPAVGQVLLLTFEQYLQDDWTPEHKKAWTDAYEAIASQMLQETGSIDTQERSQSEIPALPTATSIAEPTNSPLPRVPDEIEAEEIPALAPSELPVELLERSFAKIKLRADEFAASFYENLFQAHPEVKPLFAHVEMAKQQNKLFSALVLVVENFRNPNALSPLLNSLGARHVGYGSLPKQYPAIGKALLLTFEQYLQDDWTPELKKAWTDAYRTIAAQMLQGATKQTPPQVTQEKTETSEQTESKTGFKQRFQEFQAKVSNQQWKTLPKRVLKRLIEAFWAAPAWLVAAIAVVTWSGIFVIAKENSLLAKVLEGADTKSLILALLLFIKETPDRRKQFHYYECGSFFASILYANGVFLPKG